MVYSLGMDLNHDPFDDERKPYTLDEFVAVAKAELDKYAEEWRGQNDYYRQSHTWDEWMNGFLQYMSW